MKHLYALFLLSFTACPWDPRVVDPVPPGPPGPAKLAYVFSDNGDPSFGPEAIGIARALRARGWTTYLTGESAGQLRPLAALADAVARTASGDRVLIDIQTHGGDVSAVFNTNAGPQTLGFGWGAQWYALNTGAYYPTDPAIFGTHGLAIWDAASEISDWITPESLAPSVRALRAKGVTVAVFDHSCNGGATVEYFANDDVCAVSTAGIMGPGLTGWPALSTAIPSLTDVDKAAKWLTQTIDRDNRARGGRLHQSGFATGCDQTMPVRDTLDATMSGFGTWWHWSRLSAEHVAREPYRYTIAEEAAEPTQTAGWHPDVANAEGWRAWLFEGLREVEQNSLLTAAEKTTLRTQVVTLGAEVQAQRAAVDALRNNLLNTTVAHNNGSFTLDTFLREAITSQCICARATGNAFWVDYIAHTDCAGRMARAQSVSIALRPTASSCTEPRSYANTVMAAFPVVKAAYDNLIAQEARVNAAAIAVSNTLNAPEMRCTSTTCSSFRF